MLAEEIEELVAKHYMESSDFNGIPGQLLKEQLGERYDPNILKTLILRRRIHLVSSQVFGNPHVHLLENIDPQQQVELLDSGPGLFCLYPTKSLLSEKVDVSRYWNRPYTQELALGEPQLDWLVFDLEVLELYFNNPQYLCQNDDVTGSISVSDEYFESPEMRSSDQVILQTFGFAFGEGWKRYVAVFLRYLSDLSPEHQQIWKARQQNSGRYLLHQDYYRSSILAEFYERISVLDAILHEIHEINVLSDKLERPVLFRDDYLRNGRPDEFGWILRPTKKNYRDFIQLLDKMLSDNISRKFFREEVPFEEELERDDGKIEVKQRGTIAILEGWLASVHSAEDERIVKIICALREVRKQRNKPAHRVKKNEYDDSVTVDQREIVESVYLSLRELRNFLSEQQGAEHYEAPEIIQDTDKIWFF